jgi:hypothetical protein
MIIIIIKGRSTLNKAPAVVEDASPGWACSLKLLNDERVTFAFLAITLAKALTPSYSPNP